MIWSGHQLRWSSEELTIYGNALALATSLLVGRLLARWSPGRELAACLAYAMCGMTLNVILTIALPGTGIWEFLGDVACRAPVLAGAVYGRYRTPYAPGEHHRAI